MLAGRSRVARRRRGEPLRAIDALARRRRSTAAPVLDVVHELPSPYRETLVAIDVLGLSYAEGGAALGVPTGTVMSRLHRGRAKVAERLRALELAPAS